MTTRAATTLTLSGYIGDEKHRYSFDVELADPGEGRRYEFVARLWAIRRIGDILDQIDLHGKNSELVDELVELSKNTSILTPYTSFLADETTNLHAGVEPPGPAQARTSITSACSQALPASANVPTRGLTS